MLRYTLTSYFLRNESSKFQQQYSHFKYTINRNRTKLSKVIWKFSKYSPKEKEEHFTDLHVQVPDMLTVVLLQEN